MRVALLTEHTLVIFQLIFSREKVVPVAGLVGPFGSVGTVGHGVIDQMLSRPPVVYFKLCFVGPPARTVGPKVLLDQLDLG